MMIPAYNVGQQTIDAPPNAAVQEET